MVVSLLIEFESEKLKAIADAGAYNGSVFADAAGEDECVEAAECGTECAAFSHGLRSEIRG